MVYANANNGFFPASLDALPTHMRKLTPDVPYRVDMSDALLAVREETIAHYEAQAKQGT